ncbi:hypothetical protein KUTeg_009285 [Tegillarca granosa]|uniref:Uncharacterized protein n=1 Tax=Tegillarca granosa TaxID=220873 RepID=A0ABQ9F771_TEGGR|nr:hypothetical protein KUTeg_009285 [Tegillarca granosa]
MDQFLDNTRYGNLGRKPKHSLTYDDTKRVVDFILGYSNDFGLPQPAAPRGVNNLPSIFLPCSDTKLNIFRIYEKACFDSNNKAVGLSSFKDIWLKCCPHIRISTPRDDVCQKCEIFRRRIQDAVSDEDKLLSTSEFKLHLEKCQTERTIYAACIRQSLDELHGVVRPPGIINLFQLATRKCIIPLIFQKT